MKPIPYPVAIALVPRIMAKIAVNGNGCWLRVTALNPQGYGNISHSAKGITNYYMTHRVMYVLVNGFIPDGFDIDHLCEQPSCCNPSHLRAVTHAENVLRSRRNPAAINARKKVCNQGHSLEAIGPGKRSCPTCRKTRERARKKELRDAGVVPEGESHGTVKAYRTFGCRCDECRAASSAKYYADKAAKASA